MGLTLEIDEYKSLDTLGNDISEAARVNTHHIYDRETPMIIELSKNDYKKLETDLRAEGSYAGIREDREFMHNQWSMAGIQVSFTLKKEDGAI